MTTQLDTARIHDSSSNPVLDPTEAPAGYFAVLKASLAHNKGNLCRQCDWRPECQKPETDFLKHGHRCMSYAIITAGGREVQRRDGQSVAFKLSPPDWEEADWPDQ